MIKKNLLQLTHGHKMQINKNCTVQIKQEDMVFMFMNIPSNEKTRRMIYSLNEHPKFVSIK